MKPLLSLHDQGTRCSSFFPPPATSPLPSSSAGSSLKRLLLVLVSLGFPCLGECSHTSLKHPRPPPPRTLSCSEFTDRQSCSLLSTSTSSPKLPLPSVVWTAEELRYPAHTQTHTYIYIFVYCVVFFMGSHRVQQTPAEMYIGNRTHSGLGLSPALTL